MNILHLHPGPDTGGTSMGAKAALEATGDEVRVFARAMHAYGYPQAMLWEAEAVDESIDWADLVIIHNDPSVWFPIAKGRAKPLMVLHHGSRFRRYHDALYAQAAAMGAVQLVSTVDLLLSVPSGGRAYWIPQALDTARMVEIALAHREPVHNPILVAHAPTNRAIKGTRHIIHAARRLDGLVRLTVIEHKPWATCLQVKASSDIFVDQLLLGYGNNSLEAWGLGLPVIAGASDAILERMRTEYGRLPFAAASPATIGDVMRSLATSADLRAEWAERGRDHIARFHAPAAFAARAHELFEMVAKRPIAA